MRYDLHVHTNYSKCSVLSIKRLERLVKEKEIFPAITDHNTIKGALKAKREIPNVIVGEEITTKKGELIGLFLNEKIPKNKQLMEAIDLVHEQGGIVGVPHCFDKVRFRSAMGFIPKSIDFVEVCNSRTIFDRFDKKARTFAVLNDLPMSAGSDAHSPLEYGKSFVEIEEFSSSKQFLKNLRKAEFHCNKSLPVVHGISLASKMFRKALKSPTKIRKVVKK